jgi:hypothetical protein
MTANSSPASDTPILDVVLERVGAGVVTWLLASVSGCITLVAGAFALYAGLKHEFSPPAASAGTALAFVLITAFFGVVAPKMLRSRSRAAQERARIASFRLSSGTLRSAAEIGLAVIGALTEFALRRGGDQRRRRRSK